MRLLHTTELRFQEFFNDSIPDYAILSHRWGNDEVSYQGFVTDSGRDGSGYAKILAACELAAGGSYRRTSQSRSGKGNSRLNWIWIDTCCIDKSSSAELSEAVNSMYRWYANSKICFAYLSDVAMEDNLDTQAFRASRWFTRGWTLQELLAPVDVSFFDQSWNYIGTRNSLARDISYVTHVHLTHIKRQRIQLDPREISIAEKFSWISMRSTSRPEDQAYCLMGLSSVNMPLLYGEGRGAFRRLQLELLRSTNDESIFLWHLTNKTDNWQPYCGLLGSDENTPVYPQHGSNHLYMRGKVAALSRPPYTVTNQGLEIRVPKSLSSQSSFFLPLNYQCVKDGFVIGVYAVLLARVESVYHDGWYRWIPRNSTRTLPKLPVAEFDGELLLGLFVAPESSLWSREKLAKVETEIIYVEL